MKEEIFVSPQDYGEPEIDFWFSSTELFFSIDEHTVEKEQSSLFISKNITNVCNWY